MEILRTGSLDSVRVVTCNRQAPEQVALHPIVGERLNQHHGSFGFENPGRMLRRGAWIIHIVQTIEETNQSVIEIRILHGSIRRKGYAAVVPGVACVPPRLERTQVAIDEVSWQVGYEDAAFFRRLFKRTTGLRLGAYRKRFRLPEFART